MPNSAERCAVCGGEKFRKVSDIGQGLLERCSRCGVIVNRVKRPLSGKEYYASGHEGLYDSYYRAFRQKQFREALRRLGSLNIPVRRLLDIGCSYGWFLKEAKTYGWDAFGAEPSDRVFEEIIADRDLRVHKCGIEGLGGIDGKFGLITMWNVFEHLPDPKAAVKAVSDKLEKGGVLLICVPSAGGLMTRASFLAHRFTFGKAKDHLYRFYRMDNDHPHLFHYSRKNLERLLRDAGLDPFVTWGQDIVDADNIGERVKGYAGEKGPIKAVLVWAIRGLLDLSRLLGMQDEIVVVARKL